MSTKYLFGRATRDITPSYPVMLHGYASRHRKAGEQPQDYVREPVSLGALALSDGQKTVLFLTMDSIGVRVGPATEIRRRVAEATGLPMEAVVISASHSHFAPAVNLTTFSSPRLGVTEPDDRYVQMVYRRAVEAAQESLEQMQEGRLEFYRVKVPSVAFNRRTIVDDGTVETNYLYPEDPGAYTFSPVDEEMTALRVRTDSGIQAVLVNFGCHPVTGAEEGDQAVYGISADYPYYLRKEIADRYGCPVFFTLGAAGDAVPLNRKGDCRRQIGAVLGNSVLLGERAFSGMAYGNIAFRVERLEVETIFPTADEERLEEQYETARERLLAIEREGERGTEAWRKASEEFADRALHWFRHRLYPTDRFTVEVQFVRVGELVFVGLPFEVLSEFSLRMKEEFPFSVLLSVTNGYQGYLPFFYEFDRGGYEATPASAHFREDTADQLYTLVQRVLREV